MEIRHQCDIAEREAEKVTKRHASTEGSQANAVVQVMADKLQELHEKVERGLADIKTEQGRLGARVEAGLAPQRGEWGGEGLGTGGTAFPPPPSPPAHTPVYANHSPYVDAPTFTAMQAQHRNDTWGKLPHQVTYDTKTVVSHSTSSARGSLRADKPPASSRHLNIPAFKGNTNARGYFKLFQQLAAGVTTDREEWKRMLCGKLEGAALSWLLGQEEDWEMWTYEEIKEKLLLHFQGESTIHERKLMNLRCGSDLVKFNEDFALLAAAATPGMGSKWVKSVYLQAVYPRDLALFLSTYRHESLQQIMSKALEVDAVYKSQRGKGMPSQQPQNPDRHRCPTCSRWKFK